MGTHLSHAFHHFTNMCLPHGKPCFIKPNFILDSSFLCCAWLCCHTHAHSSFSCFSSILPLPCGCIMLLISAIVTQVSQMIKKREQRVLPSRTYTYRGKQRQMSKESFKVGRRLVEIIKSLASSGVTRWTKGEGGLGLGASDLRQRRCNACIAQIKSTE